MAMPPLEPVQTANSQRDRIELELLLEAIYRMYGYDFSAYARASIERRVRLFLTNTPFKSVSALIPSLLHDAEFAARLIRHFSIPVTEMFRDPFVYLAVQRQILPVLRTWPHIKIWHAGCATGEEVYSLAILLKEEGLYDRATIYATDFNDDALERAQAGIYEPAKLKEATRHYQAAGGTRSFSDYYHAAYDAVVLDPALRERILFANHNLAADGVFGEMQLIFCRNVLIYFNRDLQNRVLALFADSLGNGGFLCLGTKEDLQTSAVNSRFEPVNAKARLYKRIGS